MINPTTIEEIKSRMDIVDVVGDFVNLKRSGQNYKALSPFNNEKTPSFYVVPSKGIFKDFSSGKGGDAITFVMEVDGLSYVEALKFLANKYGIEIIEDEKPDGYQEAQNERESLFIVLNFAKNYYQELLWEDPEGKSVGLSYFRERGFKDETIKEFELGYSLDKWDGLIKEAEKKGYKQEYLEKSGLKIVKENKAYDRFRGRVIFPIHNLSGKPVAFGARILVKDKKQPKYINSPETLLYHKSNVLYGIFQAKQSIRQLDNCYLVEGYTDVISFHQAGITNVVASSGTALTEEQIKLIGRFTKNITVLFDGDKAGIKAAMRGIDMILESGLNVRALAFPDGEDPDSYARQMNPATLRNFLEKEAADFIRFKTSLYNRDAEEDPVKRAETIREIVNSISRIPDPIKREVYLRDTANVLDITENTLISELNKILIRKNQEAIKEQRNEELKPIEAVAEVRSEKKKDGSLEIVKTQEGDILKLLLNYAANTIEDTDQEEQYLITYLLTEVEDVEFHTPEYNRIIDICRERYEMGEIISPEYLLNLEDELKPVIAELVTEKYEASRFWEEKYSIYIPKETDFLKTNAYKNVIRLKHWSLDALNREVLSGLKQAKGEAEESEIQIKYFKLKQMQTQLGNILGVVVLR